MRILFNNGHKESVDADFIRSKVRRNDPKNTKSNVHAYAWTLADLFKVFFVSLKFPTFLEQNPE